MFGFGGLPFYGVLAAVSVVVLSTTYEVGNSRGRTAGYAQGHDIGYKSGYSDGYKTGVSNMSLEVERRNQASAEQARQARAPLEACWDKGGEWSQETGKCDR